MRITGEEDGSSSLRNTHVVLEEGSWKHRFTKEELGFLIPGTSFEEFV